MNEYTQTINLSLKEKVLLLGPKPVLLLCVFGDKKITRPNWEVTLWELTQTPAYQSDLFSGRYNVGVLLGPRGGNICTIDIDVEDEREWEGFLELNSWAKATLITRGSKGCQIWFRFKGDYPQSHRTIHSELQPPRKKGHVEFRATGNQSILHGLHPASTSLGYDLFYSVVKGLPAIEIEYSDIRWPSWWSGNPKGENERKLPERKLSWTPNILVRQKNAQEFINKHQEFKDKIIEWDKNGHFGFCECPGKEMHGQIGRESKDAKTDCKIRIGTGKQGKDQLVEIFCYHESCAELRKELSDELYNFLVKNEAVIFYDGIEKFPETVSLLYQRAKDSGRFFYKNCVWHWNPATLKLLPLEKHTLVSALANSKIITSVEKVKGNGIEYRPYKPRNDELEELLKDPIAEEILPTILTIVHTPILVEAGEGLVCSPVGYQRATGTFVTCDEEIPDLSLEEALKGLNSLLDNFDFATPHDRSRAMAALLTPALHQGDFVGRHIPAWVVYADKLKAGKTLLQYIVGWIYNFNVASINNNSRHSAAQGKLDELLNFAIADGDSFIQIDNIRGMLDSQVLESILTHNGHRKMRLAYRGYENVPVPRIMVMMTGNTGFQVTADQASRSFITKLTSKSERTDWTMHGEPIDKFVPANWKYYFACVAAVSREWIKRGKPVTPGQTMRFYQWAQTVDWIVEHICGLPRPSEGLNQAQNKLSSPAQDFAHVLFDLVAEDEGTGVKGYRAIDLFRLCQEGDIEIPGTERPFSKDYERLMASRIASLIKELELVSEGGHRAGAGFVHVFQGSQWRAGHGTFPVKHYLFSHSAQRPSSYEPVADFSMV